ncbi:hypothetical protein BD311DRAFT_757507 [Dichomitus squalens]|uniref:Uncharacterized protein n=1 Tax=Dichomitus squalens TaxID=114155 RepID=A0A4Q9MP84_9APHY|nr:hypothetical protein BD311DRAFT_757507 [Dichomitus squalens]
MKAGWLWNRPLDNYPASNPALQYAYSCRTATQNYEEVRLRGEAIHPRDMSSLGWSACTWGWKSTALQHCRDRRGSRDGYGRKRFRKSESEPGGVH